MKQETLSVCLRQFNLHQTPEKRLSALQNGLAAKFQADT